jgi:TonB family protein
MIEEVRNAGCLMSRFFLAMMLLGCTRTLTAQTEPENHKSPFQPAETLSVTDILDSIQYEASGTVVLDALINDKGDVERVEVRRDIPSLTEPAESAVESWKFSPATVEGKAIASRVPVAITFRPPMYYSDPVTLPALIPQTEEAIQAEFQPAEVTRAAIPKYPSNTYVAGSVVLEVTLSAKGKVEGEAKVLRDLPPLTEAAKDAVGDFQFMPAAYNGKPVESRIVLAFVFRQLAIYSSLLRRPPEGDPSLKIISQPR